MIQPSEVIAAPLTSSAQPPVKLSAAELVQWRLVLNSVPQGHFAVGDQHAVAAYVKLLLQVEAAQKAADGQPFVSHTSHGDAVSPHWRAVDLLQRRLMAMQTALRLTPAARKRIPMSRLGAERATSSANARAQAKDKPGDAPDRSHLLFGGLAREASKQ